MKNIFLILSLFILSSSLFGQEFRGEVGLGQWKSYLPYTEGVSVTQSKEKIYFATIKSLFTVDKEEYSIELLNKVNGLSDIGVRTIRYNIDENNPENEVLLVAYENSNIDLIKNGRLININSIKTKSIQGDKRINNIFFEGAYAWLACGFGIVKFDVVNEEISFTTFSNGLVINDISVLDEKVYASTNSGIFVAENNADVNLVDFGNWNRIDNLSGLPISYSSNTSAVKDGKLYTDINDTLYEYDGISWDSLCFIQDYRFRDLYMAPDRIVASMVSLASPDFPAIISPIDGSFTMIENNNFTGGKPNVIEDEAGNLWAADFFRGFGLLTKDNNFQSFVLSGPQSVDIGKITIFDDELWMASTNLDPKWQYKESPFGFASLIDQKWTTYWRTDYPVLFDYLDVNDVVVHPETKNVFAASYYGGGVIEYDRTDFTIYRDNSSLQSPVVEQGVYRISGLAFDQDNHLWVSNYTAPLPLSVFTNEREWQAFSVPPGMDEVTHIVVDENNYKWIATNSSGVLVYDSGEDPLSPADDKYKVLNTSSSILESNDILSLAVDLDGYVWVGTGEGVFLFDCTGLVFENECPGRRPIAQEEDINDLLLATESINAIAVDGANRKWFGTTNGVFVLETDATEAIYTFNTANSPLFDNNIVDIAINGKNGEVFIGTGQGLLSYRNNATAGAGFYKKEEIYAFPNPVRPDFEGEIAITGLMADSNIKITDAGGTLVYETESLGGQAVWDGRNYNGQKVRSGVYLVFASSKDGQDKVVTKLLFLN